MEAQRTRPLRADAQHNHDRLLEVAASAFARDGAEASLKAIAKEAGVGIGTLYRRFPTREQLIEATYRSQTERLCGSAAALLADHDPPAALRAWMDGFVAYTETKHGMAESLPMILATRDGLRMHSRGLLSEAIDTILRAGVEDGSLRGDVAAADVMMAVGGTTLITEHEDDTALTGRLLDLLMDGLTTRSGSLPDRERSR
jgi:AcrR family transcriptional regulator